MLNKHFAALRKTCNKRNIPLISQNTKAFLQKLLAKHKPKNCLEIGSAIGYSSLYIAKQINKRDGQLTCFEISFPSYQEALENFFKSGLYNLQIYNTNFNKVPVQRLLKHNIDFAFIDARKKDYLNYFIMIYPYLRDDAIVLMDDVIKFNHKMSDLYKFFEENQLQYHLHPLDQDDGVLVVNIKSNHNKLEKIIN